MRAFPLFIALTVAICVQAHAAPESDAVRSAMLRAYTENLIEAHQDEEKAKRDLNAIAPGPEQTNEVMASIIQNGTTTRMNLRVALARIEGIKVSDANFSGMLPGLITQYQAKTYLYSELIETAKTMLAGPKSGIDYGKIAGHIPEITAQLDFVNKSLFHASTLVCLFLVSQKPDSKNQASHLGITRKEAQTTIDRLQVEFGTSMEDNQQSWTTLSAGLLRGLLRDKGYLYADDPLN